MCSYIATHSMCLQCLVSDNVSEIIKHSKILTLLIEWTSLHAHLQSAAVFTNMKMLECNLNLVFRFFF